MRYTAITNEHDLKAHVDEADADDDGTLQVELVCWYPDEKKENKVKDAAKAKPPKPAAQQADPPLGQSKQQEATNEDKKTVSCLDATIMQLPS